MKPIIQWISDRQMNKIGASETLAAIRAKLDTIDDRVSQAECVARTPYCFDPITRNMRANDYGRHGDHHVAEKGGDHGS